MQLHGAAPNNKTAPGEIWSINIISGSTECYLVNNSFRWCMRLTSSNQLPACCIIITLNRNTRWPLLEWTLDSVWSEAPIFICMVSVSIIMSHIWKRTLWKYGDSLDCRKISQQLETIYWIILGCFLVARTSILIFVCTLPIAISLWAFSCHL